MIPPNGDKGKIWANTEYWVKFHRTVSTSHPESEEEDFNIKTRSLPFLRIFGTKENRDSLSITEEQLF